MLRCMYLSSSDPRGAAGHVRVRGQRMPGIPPADRPSSSPPQILDHRRSDPVRPHCTRATSVAFALRELRSRPCMLDRQDTFTYKLDLRETYRLLARRRNSREICAELPIYEHVLITHMQKPIRRNRQ